MAAGKGRKIPSKKKTMGRKARRRKKESSGEGGGPQPGRIEYGPILSVTEVATYLRVTVRTIHRLKATGELPFARIGGRVLFRRQDLEAFVNMRMENKPRGRK